MSYGVPADDRMMDVTLTAGQTIIDTDFPVLANADLTIVRVRAGVETALVLDTDYSLADVGDLGYKRVTLVSQAVADDRLILRGTRALARTSNLLSGEMRASVFNEEFNALIVGLQEAARDRGMALRIASTDDLSASLILPKKADRLGRFLRFHHITGAPEAVDSPVDSPVFHVEAALPTSDDGKDGDIWLVVNAVVAEHGNIYAKSSGSWSLGGNVRGPAGTGDVDGPLAASDNAIPRFDGDSGKVLQASGVAISDDGDISGLRNVGVAGYVDVDEVDSAPAAPATGFVRFYAGADGLLRSKDDAGIERTIGLPASAINENLLINGDFQINQRAFAGGDLTAGNYGFDRWKSSGVTSNLNLSGYVMTMTTNSKIEQIVEPNLFGLTSFSGLQMTISVEDPSGNIDVSFGSQAGTIASGSGRRGITVSLSPGDTGNLSFSLERSVSGSVSFGRVKLEIGQTATDFVKRPNELQLAQRYYYRRAAASNYDPLCIMQAFAATAAFGKVLDLPVTMRGAPSIGVSAAGHLSLYGNSGQRQVTAVHFGSSNKDMISSWDGVSVASGLSIDAGAQLYFNNAAGWIDADCEL